MRGGIVAGIGPDGKEKAVRATRDGKLVVAEDVAEDDRLFALLLEMRALRIGKELELDMEPGELLRLAEQVTDKSEG